MSDEVLRQIAADGQAMGSIELELLRLNRYLEMIGRRTDLYRRVDRAGYLLLRTLEETGPLNINALSDMLGLHASTVTRQVNRLEASGFVSRRVNSDDQRSSTIGLKASGRRIMCTVEKERCDRLESLLADWSQQERDSLEFVLAKFNESIASSPQYRELRGSGADTASLRR